MKVIFLDVDGVLNSDDYFDKLENEKIEGIEADIDRKSVELIKVVLEYTGAKVVLTTSWRYKEKVIELKKLLLEYGIETELTPYINNKRGTEIKEYLNTHKGIVDYVVLDDDIFPDFDEEILNHLIRVSPEGMGKGMGKGLTLENAKEIIKRFGPSKKIKKETKAINEEDLER